MKDRRRLLINTLRIVLSAALLFVAYKLIRFQDVVIVRRDGLELEAKEVRAEGENYRVILRDSERVVPKEGTAVEPQYGFWTLFKRIDRRTYFLLVPVFLLPFFFCAVRWWLLLRAHGFDTSLRSVFAVTYMGSFFNNFLPGSVGGDIARAMIAAKGEDRKAALVGTILLDRIVGLGTMILMAAVCLIPFVGDRTMRIPVLLVGSLLIAMIAGYLLYFSRTIRNWGWLQRRKGQGKVGRVVRDLDGTFHLLKHRKDTVLFAALLSLLAQSVTIVATFGLARGLGVTQVSLLQFFVFDPIIFIVTAVPVSAGGWGVQEGAYAFFFGKAGVPANEAIAISILYKLTLVFLSLPGGILFGLGALRRRRESGTAPQVGGATGDLPAHE